MKHTGWPLTFTVMHLLDGDRAGAAQSLPPTDQVTGLDLLWRNQLARDQQVLPAGLEPDATKDRVDNDARALLADLTQCDVATWPVWHRTAFSRALTVPLLRGAALGLDDDLSEALIGMRQAIVGEDAEDAEITVLRNMIIGGPKAR